MEIALLMSNFLLGAEGAADGQMANYANLGATVALSFIVIFMITKGLPYLLNSQREERDALLKRIDKRDEERDALLLRLDKRDENRDDLLLRLDKRDEERRQDNELLRATLEKMLSHCTKVNTSGTNT